MSVADVAEDFRHRLEFQVSSMQKRPLDSDQRAKLDKYKRQLLDLPAVPRMRSALVRKGRGPSTYDLPRVRPQRTS